MALLLLAALLGLPLGKLEEGAAGGWGGAGSRNPPGPVSCHELLCAPWGGAGLGSDGCCVAFPLTPAQALDCHVCAYHGDNCFNPMRCPDMVKYCMTTRTCESGGLPGLRRGAGRGGSNHDHPLPLQTTPPPR